MGLWDTIKGIGKVAAPFLGPIGSIAGAAADIWSQKSANAANANNVQKQMDFQAQQSGTQYQRATADMAAAGLNPALAYQQGGDTPATGAAATAQPIFQNSASRFASAAEAYTAFANGVAQRDLMREQATAAQTSAQLQAVQANALRPDAILGQNEDYRSAYFKKRMAQAAAETFTAEKTEDTWRANIANIGAGTAQSQAAAARARSETTLNEQEFQTEWFRKNVAPYLNNTAAGLRAAGGLKDLIDPFNSKWSWNKEAPKPERMQNYDEYTEFFKGGSRKQRTYRP